MSRFGSPNYESIWFEDNSLNYPNGAHFDNLRNEIKTWREHVLSNGVYPCFTSWATGVMNESEDDIGSIIQISDSESNVEETSFQDEIIIKDSKAIMSKGKLETLWKLYRNIGETEEDMKIRLVDSLLNSEKDNFFNNENPYNNCLKVELEEYNDGYADSEKENKYSVSNIASDMKEEKDLKLNNVSIKLENIKSEFAECEPVSSDSNCTNYNFDDILDIQLEETNESIELSDTHDDIDIQDWPFESTIWHNNLRNYESQHLSPNCAYDVPRLKEITSKELIICEEKKRSSKMKRKRAVAAKKENDKFIKRPKEPIICDMYGIRTINYNESSPSPVKMPSCFKTSRLSDSSFDEEIEVFEKHDFAGSSKLVSYKKRKSSVLKNRYQNNKKRRITPADHNGFLNSFAVDLSSDSSFNTTEDSNMKRKMIEISDKQVTHDFNDNLSEDELDEQLEIKSTSSTTSSSSSTTCTRSSCSCSTSTYQSFTSEC